MAIDGGKVPTNKVQIALDSDLGTSCWLAERMPEVPKKPKLLGVKFWARTTAFVQWMETAQVASAAWSST